MPYKVRFPDGHYEDLTLKEMESHYACDVSVTKEIIKNRIHIQNLNPYHAMTMPYKKKRTDNAASYQINTAALEAYEREERKKKRMKKIAESKKNKKSFSGKGPVTKEEFYWITNLAVTVNHSMVKLVELTHRSWITLIKIIQCKGDWDLYVSVRQAYSDLAHKDGDIYDAWLSDFDFSMSGNNDADDNFVEIEVDPIVQAASVEFRNNFVIEPIQIENKHHNNLQNINAALANVLTPAEWVKKHVDGAYNRIEATVRNYHMSNPEWNIDVGIVESVEGNIEYTKHYMDEHLLGILDFLEERVVGWDDIIPIVYGVSSNEHIVYKDFIEICEHGLAKKYLWDDFKYATNGKLLKQIFGYYPEHPIQDRYVNRQI